MLPARRQSESVDGHQPNSSALGASSSQRQLPAGPGRDVQPVHSRLDQLLQPLPQDAVASDPEERQMAGMGHKDRFLVHSRLDQLLYSHFHKTQLRPTLKRGKWRVWGIKTGSCPRG